MINLVLGPLLRHVGTTDATVWVETDRSCEVDVLGCRERTWTVAGHHYALVCVAGLAPGSSVDYEVRLDGEVAWPPAGSARPPSRIRTLGDGRPVRIAFGSCRYATTDVVSGDRHFDVDALDCYARKLAALPGDDWPEALVMLGDQVYADETSEATQRRMRARRDITAGAGDQVADFEEYTWLYHESWTDPEVRWLLSTVPTSMIFDDHDVRDDWNTSRLWREDIKRTSWWRERIIGALSSYWVYQHLGNLSPAELAANELYQSVRTAGVDAEEPLRRFAELADREADGEKGARWSFRRDFGRVRLLMIDSRCGRVLAEGRRSMVSDAEFRWIEDQLAGEFDHLLIGTSLPWLLPRALHDIESWNEALCEGARGARIAAWSEKFRRAADLEHWAAFRESFDRLGALIAEVGRAGSRPPDGGAPDGTTPDGTTPDGTTPDGTTPGGTTPGGTTPGGTTPDGRTPDGRTPDGTPGVRAADIRAPATVCVLSGDVHHAYVAQAHFQQPMDSLVYQITCSPLHNYVPAAMKIAFRVSWSRFAEHLTRLLLGLVGRVPKPTVRWSRRTGPHFGDEIATLRLDGRRAELLLEKAGSSADRPELHEVARLTL